MSDAELASLFPSPSDVTPSSLTDCSLLPNFGELLGLFKSLVTQALWAAVQGFTDLFNTIWSLLCAIFGGLFPLSAPTPLFGNIRMPELEIEYKIRALMKEFKFFFCIKIFEILEDILGGILDPILDLPLPMLADFTVRDLTSEEGRSAIMQYLRDEWDTVKDLLPAPFKNLFDGTYGISSISMAIVEFFQNMIIQVVQMIVQPLFTAFELLISTFQTLWDSLSLPEIPTFQDFWSDIKDIIDGIVDDAGNTMDDIITLIGNIELPLPDPLGPITLREVLNLPAPEDDPSNLKMKAHQLATMMQMAFINAVQIPIIMLEQWIEDIMDFLLALIDPFPIPIPFTFCDFLELALPGFPPTIPSIPAEPTNPPQIPPITFTCS